MNDGNFRGCCERIKEVSDNLVHVAVCLLDLCSPFPASIFETLVYIILQDVFDVKTFREYLSCVADCNRTGNDAWKQCLLEPKINRE